MNAIKEEQLGMDQMMDQPSNHSGSLGGPIWLSATLLNLDEKIKWHWRNESCRYSKVGKSCPQGYRDAMLTMAKENNQSKKVLPHHKVQQWIIVANECHKGGAAWHGSCIPNSD
jgi:hypothetical protein